MTRRKQRETGGRALKIEGTANKMKPVTVSIVSPSICHEVMGPDAMMLDFEW